MGAKILAGFVAAVLVTVIGVYVAMTNYPTTAVAENSTESLTVSEGSCCGKAKSCCAEESAAPSCSPDTLGACAGSASVGAMQTPAAGCSKKGSVGCCDE